MHRKRRSKYLVDIAMLALLPVLMAQLLTGQQLHEWLGTAALLLFVLHHLLNLPWWRGLCRGSYSPVRGLTTAVNLLMLADLAALLVSGVVISGYVFRFLPLSGGMVWGRKLHLIASYWGLLLMSAHLGLHAGMAVKKQPATPLSRVGFAAVLIMSLYGGYAFCTQRIGDYLFLRTHFVRYDETKGNLLFLLETVAIMMLFATVFCLLRRWLSSRGTGEKPTAG